jgi:hypothetical protein
MYFSCVIFHNCYISGNHDAVLYGGDCAGQRGKSGSKTKAEAQAKSAANLRIARLFITTWDWGRNTAMVQNKQAPNPLWSARNGHVSVSMHAIEQHAEAGWVRPLKHFKIIYLRSIAAI